MALQVGAGSLQNEAGTGSQIDTPATQANSSSVLSGTAPIRIQRKRTRGWKMPPNTVSVARPGRWGNPYRATLFRDYTPEQRVADFKRWLDGDHGARVWAGPPPTKAEIREKLQGKNLACFCPLGQLCHADVLLEIANK